MNKSIGNFLVLEPTRNPCSWAAEKQYRKREVWKNIFISFRKVVVNTLTIEVRASELIKADTAGFQRNRSVMLS